LLEHSAIIGMQLLSSLRDIEKYVVHLSAYLQQRITLG
jgi:hypothetical protein